jgi:hypothetical protein
MSSEGSVHALMFLTCFVVVGILLVVLGAKDSPGQARTATLATGGTMLSVVGLGGIIAAIMYYYSSSKQDFSPTEASPPAVVFVDPETVTKIKALNDIPVLQLPNPYRSKVRKSRRSRKNSRNNNRKN